MFLAIEIKKLLTDIIPSAPVEGVFDKYEIMGKPFFDKENDAFITPAITFCPFRIRKDEDKFLRSIYFILKKNISATSEILIFSGTIEELSRITVEEFMNKINTISGRMLVSLTEVK